jgi:hypothetical protein
MVIMMKIIKQKIKAYLCMTCYGGKNVYNDDHKAKTKVDLCMISD